MKIQSKALMPQVTLLILEGEFDVNDKPQVSEALEAAAAEGSKWLLFDMSRVSFIDSVAVGTLIRAAKSVTPQQGDVAVIAPQPAVLRVFEISGTKELLNAVGSIEEALVRLKVPQPPADANGEGC